MEKAIISIINPITKEVINNIPLKLTVNIVLSEEENAIFISGGTHIKVDDSFKPISFLDMNTGEETPLEDV